MIETYHITQSCFIRSYRELSRGYSCILTTPKSTIRKTTFFVNQSTTHHWYDAWRPNGFRQAVPLVPRIQQLFPCACEPQFFPSFPWHANFHKFSRNPTSNYNYLYTQRIHYQFSELVQTPIILVTFNPKGFNSN